MTEEEYLKSYRTEDYDRPSVTADVAAFMIRTEDAADFRRDPCRKLSLLLIRRGIFPYKGCWALPGGFMEMNETVEACARREITEETGLIPVSLMPVGVFSAVDRDPRGRVISNAFVCVISEDSITVSGGADAADARWFDVAFTADPDGNRRLTLTQDGICLTAVLRQTGVRFGRTDYEILDPGTLAFDHAGIIATALSALQSNAENDTVIFDFLPEKFTLTALQRVQETLRNAPQQPANFRRKIAPFVEATEEYTAGAGHRPARLYTRKK